MSNVNWANFNGVAIVRDGENYYVFLRHKDGGYSHFENGGSKQTAEGLAKSTARAGGVHYLGEVKKWW